MLSVGLVDINPAEWWVVIEVVITRHWQKALILLGAFMLYKLILEGIKARSS